MFADFLKRSHTLLGLHEVELSAQVRQIEGDYVELPIQLDSRIGVKKFAC